MQHQEIIFQHPCPAPNGTAVLADHNLLLQNHNLDIDNTEFTTAIALVIASVILFILAAIVFVLNIRKIFQSKTKST